MKFDLFIKADTNDADYVTSCNTIDESDLPKVKLMVDAIKKVDRKKSWHNWPNSDYDDDSIYVLYKDVDKKLLEWFSDLCPYGENGIHTIASVKYYPTEMMVRLL